MIIIMNGKKSDKRIEIKEGIQINDLTVIKKGRVDITKSGHKMQRWVCKCKCGRIVEILERGLKSGKAKNCKECYAEDLTGMQFGNFTVIGRAPDYIRKNGKHTRRWECKCVCGNTRFLTKTALKNGIQKSCGCIKPIMIIGTKVGNGVIHGDSHKRLHNTWLGMKARCFNKNEPRYKWYGERGIIVCDEWKHDYLAFKEWALNNGYSEELTIDRIDNNKGYSPDNCRWVDVKTQQNNRRSNRFITAFNETHTLMQWSEITGINSNAISRRIKSGWEIERALTEPIHENNKNKKVDK